MRKILATALLSIFCLASSATEQINDKVILNKETWEITSSPLMALQEEAYDSFLKLLGERNFVNTSNYRGYIAYWRIERRNLYLDKVEAPQENGGMKEIDMSLLKESLKDYLHKGRIRAEWMKGNAIIGKGRAPAKPENPHAPSFKETRTLKIRKGKVRIR